jgi:predicted Zn-dependent protease
LEGAAERVALGALVEAEFGHRRRAREQAQAALAISRGIAAQVVAAWALARAGWPRRAGELTDDLARRYPTNTMVGSVYLPTIRAAIELSRRNPARALELLQRASPYELGDWPALPAYLGIWTRGQAYLQRRAGTKAAAEFQKILDHRGIGPTSPYYALAHLGLARARALAGDTPGARRAYQDFLALWKDADPDIPILQEAKAEYAQLR